MDDVIRNEPIRQLDILDNYNAQTVAFNTDIPYWQGGQLDGIYLFGAGSITDAHSDHEYVIESDLHQAVNVYVELIEHLLKLK
jgi:acetylornithine deacetylase